MNEIAISSQLQNLLLISLAMLLGGLIGFDREVADKPAGLRTHMLVAGASAMLISLANALVTYSDISQSIVQVDPIRLTEAIFTGISFLGAGTILRHRDKGASVEGLTTAASLLFVAVIGISVALNQYFTAIGGTILILVTLRLIKLIAQKSHKIL